MSNYRLAVLLLGSVCAAESVLADDGQYPNVGMDYDATFQFDHVHADTPQGGNRNSSDAYPDINSTFYFRFSRDQQIQLSTEINPIDPPKPGQKRFFDDVGLVVNDLNYYQNNANSAFMVGKYHVPFGRAADTAPGLYTEDFVATYDLDGMLGGTVAYRYFDQTLGMIEPNVSVYTADNSFLGRPYFRHGEKLQRSDGGPSNTGKLDSYALTVNWLAIPAIPFLEMQVGYMANKQGEDVPQNGNAADETIKVASARYIWAYAPSTDLEPTLAGHYFDIVPFVEFADVHNEDAIQGNDTRYLTTSLTFDFGDWAVGATRTDKQRQSTGGADHQDYLNELSVTYNITGQIKLGVSAGTQKEDGQVSDLIGLALTYSGGY
ncbi:hypothetical protein JFU48_22425 [Pseudomonas sp. TH49]|uniref:hypothetical protein n=1 Tax=unclassified Pseudomonas TaxID=196821 RepID=UPI001912B450|nr:MULTISPECIES: hypothetical protein [unclassified Pseudomonas]MBK5344135.1 hypothetical protein [Pseudomonas sp. TH49]MCU1771495.1 hypothetical protein [Pseudomonas sp. 13B_3.2_Bac1]